MVLRPVLAVFYGAFGLEEGLHDDKVEKNDDGNREKHLHASVILLFRIHLEDTVLSEQSELQKIEGKSIVSGLAAAHIDVHELGWFHILNPPAETGLTLSEHRPGLRIAMIMGELLVEVGSIVFC